MRFFGKKESVAIEYKFFDYDDVDDPGINTLSEFKFWINGVNQCRYIQNEIEHQCEWEIYYLVTWLCEKIDFLLGYDPFPLPVHGDNILGKIENADRYVTSNEFDLNLWFDAKSRWILNHCWFSSRDGAIVPCVYFCRKENFVEISIDNNFWAKGGIYFETVKETYLIPLAEFQNILFLFLKTAIADMNNRLHSPQYIKNLEKGLHNKGI